MYNYLVVIESKRKMQIAIECNEPLDIKHLIDSDCGRLFVFDKNSFNNDGSMELKFSFTAQEFKFKMLEAEE